MQINLRDLNLESLIQIYFILRNQGFHKDADRCIKEIRRRGENVHDAMQLIDNFSAKEISQC